MSRFLMTYLLKFTHRIAFSAVHSFWLIVKQFVYSFIIENLDCFQFGDIVNETIKHCVQVWT